MTTHLRTHVIRTLAAAVVSGAIAGAAGPASACNNESYTGTICYFAFPYCPEGMLPAAGQQVPVAQYQALYSLVGNYFGGTSGQTFTLPDLRGRTAVGTANPPPAGISQIQLGQRRGQETVTLTPANLPPHIHTVNGVQASAPVSTADPTTTTPTLTNGQTAYLANADTGKGTNSLEGLYTTTAPAPGATANVKVTAAGATDPTGAGQPMPTIPPELGLTACIVANGFYPMRP